MITTLFVASPIGDDGSKIRENSDILFNNYLEPICKELSLTPIRADHIATPTKITDDIHKYLDEAQIVVFDITGHNANVFYELGYRIKVGLPYVLTQSEECTLGIPFDVRTTRVFTYSLNVGKFETMKEILKSAISAAKNNKTNNKPRHVQRDNGSWSVRMK